MDIYETTNYLNSLGFNISVEEIRSNANKTVVVGMSGGVDSSVSAVLIKLMGFKTIGMFMKNWEELDNNGNCNSQKDYIDVINVCELIDIAYYSVNFAQEYKDKVFKSFLSEYKAGYTPNPDILCNREIKFKVFYEKAKAFGADYLATGHYCQKDSHGEKSYLVKGRDQGKDQTYFLYAIDGHVLKDVLFPLGHLQKSQVRDIATKFSLSTATKKDSTGICFIGERNFKNFLGQYLVENKGHFVHLETNKSLGPHDGSCFYTIGQRKGLGLGGPGGPWFVADKNTATNEVLVVEGERHPALFADYLEANEVSWINSSPDFPLKCKAKIRYRQQDQECTIYEQDGELRVDFTNPQRAISQRQSVVFYQDDICLGGAMIKSRGPTYFERDKHLPIT